MKDFNDVLNSGISDELLAAYIDGSTTESENQLIESSLNGDSILSEAYEITNDGVSFGSSFNWNLHIGDFGFWELGLPTVVTETDIDKQSIIEIPDNISLPPTDDVIAGIESKVDDISDNDFTANDLNLNDY